MLNCRAVTLDLGRSRRRLKSQATLQSCPSLSQGTFVHLHWLIGHVAAPREDITLSQVVPFGDRMSFRTFCISDLMSFASFRKMSVIISSNICPASFYFLLPSGDLITHIFDISATCPVSHMLYSVFPILFSICSCLDIFFRSYPTSVVLTSAIYNLSFYSFINS